MLGNYIITEGTPTAWGGRTVQIEIAEPPVPISTRPVDVYPRRPLAKRPVAPYRSSTARNRLIQERYLAGRTAAQVAMEFNLAAATVYYILHSMGTPMRAAVPGSGRRA